MDSDLDEFLGELRRLPEFGGHKDIDVFSVSESGDTPLHYAAHRGELVAVASLVIYGADLNAKNNHGRTAYDIAKLSGREDICRVLVDAGVARL